MLNDYCVVIGREDFKQQDDGLYPVLSDPRSDSFIPSQVDDINGDGKWDECAFLISLIGKEKITLHIEWMSKKEYPDFPVRTNIYLGISRERNGEFTEVTEEVFPPNYECGTPYQYQFEGVGWENDKIAFRTYCDMRNGKDIFGKLVSSIVLPSVGKVENYHEIDDWGMDILKVGSSLGIGAIAVIDEGKLIRLSDTGQHDFKVICEGPVRSIFELGFKDWQINGKTMSAKETITIMAARHGFKNQVEIFGENKPDAIVSGLSLIGNDGEPVKLDFERSHGIGIAGINDIDDHFLGMSVLIDKKESFVATLSPKTKDIYDTSTPEYKSTKYHSDITDTYFLSTPGSAAEFVVSCIWGGRYPCIKTAEDFQSMIEEDALHYFTTLKVRLR